MSTSAIDIGCTINPITYDCTPKSPGNSERGIFGLFGIGYASTTFDHGFDSSDNMETTSTTNAYDLSLSLLDAMIKAGVGTIIGGKIRGKHRQGCFIRDIVALIENIKVILLKAAPPFSI